MEKQRKALVTFMVIWVLYTVASSYVLWNMRWAVVHNDKVAELKIAYEVAHDRAEKEVKDYFAAFASGEEAEAGAEAEEGFE